MSTVLLLHFYPWSKKTESHKGHLYLAISHLIMCIDLVSSCKGGKPGSMGGKGWGRVGWGWGVGVLTNELPIADHPAYCSFFPSHSELCGNVTSRLDNRRISFAWEEKKKSNKFQIFSWGGRIIPWRA